MQRVNRLARDLGLQMKWALLHARWPAKIRVYLACRPRKPFYMVLWECGLVSFKFRCLPDHYFFYHLYRKQFSRQDVLSYQPHFDFFCRMLPRYDRHEDGYHYIMMNKILFHRLLAGEDVPLPPLRLVMMNGLFFNPGQEMLSPEQALEQLGGVPGDRLFYKPADGGSGHGIECWTRGPDGWVGASGQVLTASSLWVQASKRDALVEAVVTQHEAYARFHPSSVNTVRVVTQYDRRGCRVLLAGFRMGRGGEFRDNAGTGGMYTGVHIDTGMLCAVAFDNDTRTYDRHPNTGIRFAGYQLPGLQDLFDVCCRAALLLPHCRSIGWDVCCSPDGPVIIEANHHWGIEFFQRPFGGKAAFIREQWAAGEGAQTDG